MSSGEIAVMPVSLKEWQEMFERIYGEHKKQYWTSESLLLHVVEAGAEITEFLRHQNSEGVISRLPILFKRLIAFCNMMRVDLEEAVWYKYPAICPYCFRTEKCLCITEERVYRERADLDSYRNMSHFRPSSLYEWQDMFSRIYGNINKTVWREMIWFHFEEEVGEVSKAFRLKDTQALQNELADTFAWLMAFCTKLSINLDDLSWQEYPGICNECKKEKCECAVC